MSWSRKRPACGGDWAEGTLGDSAAEKAQVPREQSGLEGRESGQTLAACYR